MNRLRDAAPPHHALQFSTADVYTFEAGRPAVSEGITLVAVALPVNVPAVGTAPALPKGPWIPILVPFHVGELAPQFDLSGRGWRDLLIDGGIRSGTALFAASALGGVAFGGLHTWMGSTDTDPLWKSGITASTVPHALVFVLTVGVVYSAVLEKTTLRRTLFSPIHERFGATVIVPMTMASFIVLHLPTWLTSDTSLKGYAWQILHKVPFGLLAGWSVARLQSIFFALGLHVSGNALGLFIDQLQSENLPDFEISQLSVAILLTGATMVVAPIRFLSRCRRVPPPVF